MQVIEISKSDSWSALEPQSVLALARKAKSEVIGKRARKCCRIACGNRPAGISKDGGRGLAWKLRRLVGLIRLIITAHKQAMSSRAVQVVVEFRNRSVQPLGVRCGKTITTDIEPVGIGTSGRIRSRVLLEKPCSLGVGDELIHTGPVRATSIRKTRKNRRAAVRIHLSNLRRSDSIRARSKGVRFAAESHDGRESVASA